MNIQEVHDASVIDCTITGVDYPIWILSDDTDIPIIVVSNIINNFTLHDNMFFVGIIDCQLYEKCDIPIHQLSKIKNWVIKNKEVLLNHWFNEPYIFDTLTKLQS